MWFDIPGFPGYRINQIGQVQSLKGNEPRIMKQHPTVPKGLHSQVRLRVDGRYKTAKVHILVARVFLGPRPAGLQVCHKDGNGFNNTPSNLYYGTQSQNNFDQVAHGTHHEAARTQCERGHDFSPENTWIRTTKKGGTNRKCIKCHAINTAAYRARKKAGLVAPRKKASGPATASGHRAAVRP